MIRTLLITTAIAAALPMTAAAQAERSGATIQEIVVTAQKREERLQDVPMAITALAADALTSSGVKSALDINQVAPSVHITEGNAVLVPFVRGIGNPSNGQAIEASVSVYIDGVYYQRVSPIYFRLNNIERIEVLKGPQGTLFGRNAVGGVIHIITKDPGSDPKFHLSAGYGNYDTISGDFYASAPLGDTLGVDLAVAFNNQSKGWGSQVVRGNAEYGWDRSVQARSKLVWKPTDETTAKLSLEYSHLRTTVGLPNLGYRGTTQGNSLAPFTQYRPEEVGFYDYRGDAPPLGGGDGYGVNGQLSHDFGFATAVSITAFSRAKDIFKFDGDFIPKSEQILNLPTHRKQFSQELQLVSNPGSAFDWMVGLYHLELLTAHRGASFQGPLFAGGRLFYGSLKTKSNAVFGQGTYHITDATNLTVGLRYTKDKLHNYGYTDTFSLAGVRTPGAYIDQRSPFSKLTYKFVLDHKFTPDVLGYVSYSRGFKSGAYRVTPVQALPAARPEVLDAYEVGIKTTLLDRRLVLNSAAFYYDLADPQVSRYLGGGATVIYINAESAEVKGFEVEGSAVITDQLSANFGATLQSSKYKSFQGAPFANINPNPPYGNTPTFPGDASGNYTTRSPKFSASVGADYRIPTGQGEWKLAGNVYYNGGFYWDPDNRVKQRSYSLVNGSVTYRPRLENGWAFTVWGKNLGGTKYYLQENESGGPGGSSSSPAAPRTYGFTVALDY